MKAVVLGATKGMGRSMAQAMAARGDSLCLLGRDPETLATSAKDLELRGAEGAVACVPCDLAEREGFEAALDAADEALGQFDTVVITAGLFDQQEALEEDVEKTASLLQVNFTNTVMLCEAIRKRLLQRGGGTLCVFSSVAGDRARKPVVLYGASKAGLTYYLQGLDHKFHGEGLQVVLVKPGFVKTTMTAGLDPPPFAGEPDGVAKTVLAAMDRGQVVVYAPGMWLLVMTVIRFLPRFVMRRIGF